MKHLHGPGLNKDTADSLMIVFSTLQHSCGGIRGVLVTNISFYWAKSCCLCHLKTAIILFLRPCILGMMIKGKVETKTPIVRAKKLQ